MNTNHRNPLGPSQFENPIPQTIPTHRTTGVACTNPHCQHGNLNCDNTHSRYLAWLAKGKP
jgi:hypothetical protein